LPTSKETRGTKTKAGNKKVSLSRGGGGPALARDSSQAHEKNTRKKAQRQTYKKDEIRIGGPDTLRGHNIARETTAPAWDLDQIKTSIKSVERYAREKKII